ncbi:unnamed protein product [Gongylonema pulchrum]|uniref:Uncharacterized protein n=1 Tax=Gongylonema pulchrum TaxID=637853 RepID=A0A3P7NFF3_9BILA|nr:unnamed protein product [Gongylonema pulchrum]
MVVEETLSSADSKLSGELRHELLEWHPSTGLLALATYHASVGGEVSFFTNQVDPFTPHSSG